MKVQLAHLRERSTSGGWINFVVFATDANNRSDSGRQQLLGQLTRQARQTLQVDKSALAFVENGRTKFFGTPDLVQYLSNNGVPRWTHSIDV